LLAQNNVRAVIQYERVSGKKIKTKFTGQLRNDQKTSVRKMMKHDMGVFCAPTAFGKTVAAAAMIARRKVSTLILVHRTELLTQWKEREWRHSLIFLRGYLVPLEGAKKTLWGN